MSLTIKPVMKEASQSMASLPTKPTIMAKEEKEEEKKDKKEEELEQKLRANPMDGALEVEPMKKGGNCGMIGPGLLDVFLRLGFLKVVSAVLNILMSRMIISLNLPPIAQEKVLGHRIKPRQFNFTLC